MRLTQSIAPALLLLAAGAAQAASAWGFDDGSLQVAAKKSGESVKEKCAPPRQWVQWIKRMERWSADSVYLAGLARRPLSRNQSPSEPPTR